MMSSFLQRVLPFALTLLVGVALGGFTSLFGARNFEARPGSPSVVTVRERRGGGCRDRFLFNSRPAGRLVSIQRQTEDGAWVPTRPVGPEIYELTTRPAVIRSRPEALYSDEARRDNLSGSVMLEATLSPDGRVTDIKPRWQLGGGLTAQAVMAAQQIEFMPAIKGEVPVAQRILLEYRFGQ